MNRSRKGKGSFSLEIPGLPVVGTEMVGKILSITRAAREPTSSPTPGPLHVPSCGISGNQRGYEEDAGLKHGNECRSLGFSHRPTPSLKV